MWSLYVEMFFVRGKERVKEGGGRVADANSVEVAASVHCITCCGELFGKHHCSVLVCAIGITLVS